MEFVLDNHYHSVNYVENQTAEMKIVLDGVSFTINMHSKLDEVVYKNVRRGSDVGSVQIKLEKPNSRKSSFYTKLKLVIKSKRVMLSVF